MTYLVVCLTRSLAPGFRSSMGHVWRVFHLSLCVINFRSLPTHLALTVCTKLAVRQHGFTSHTNKYFGKIRKDCVPITDSKEEHTSLGIWWEYWLYKPKLEGQEDPCPSSTGWIVLIRQSLTTNQYINMYNHNIDKKVSSSFSSHPGWGTIKADCKKLGSTFKSISNFNVVQTKFKKTRKLC